MRFRFKTIAASVALAVGTLLGGQAQAAIDPDSQSLTANVGTGDNLRGELFLSVVARDSGNPALNNTYVRDLGVLTSHFIDSNGALPVSTLSFSPLTGLSTFLADNAGRDIAFNVTGINADNKRQFQGIVGGIPSFQHGFPGILSTGNASINPTIDSQAEMNGAAQGVYDHINAINIETDGVPNVSLTPGDIAAHNDGTVTVASQAHHDFNFGGSTLFGFGTEGVLGGSVPFFWFGLAAGGADLAFVANPIELGVWTLDSGGTLSFGASTVIPLPPAVWLMGSALLGLVGVARRRNA